MYDGSFILASGREVLLEQFHVRVSELGFLEGSPDAIRHEVIRRLPEEVSDLFGYTGFLLHEPPPGRLPAYTFFADLHSLEPIHAGADGSDLVVCWFGHSLPESIRSVVASELEGVDWDSYAKDVYY